MAAFLLVQCIFVPSFEYYQQYKDLYINISKQMSIIQVDNLNFNAKKYRKARQSWSQKFIRHLYNNNYKKVIHPSLKDSLLVEDKKNQCAVALVAFINEKQQKYSIQHRNYLRPPPQSFMRSHSQPKPFQRRGSQMDEQRDISRKKIKFYDYQVVQTFYSPYSTFIPLSTESYLNDEIINTFSYLAHLRDTAKRNQLDRYYQDIHDSFKQGKAKGRQFVCKQWQKVKQKYLCQIDSITSTCLLLQTLKKNTEILPQLHQSHSPESLPQVFLFRITSSTKYLSSLPRMHSTIPVSVQLSDPINERTLPMVMKTWYCALCMLYDCEKHKLEDKAAQYGYQYVSGKNRNKVQFVVNGVVGIMRDYDYIVAGQVKKIKGQICGKQCYKNLKKQDIAKLRFRRFQFISPLAKSLLKLGIQMFSYNPCMIHQLFQSSYASSSNLQSMPTPSILTCSLLFLHFVEQCSLPHMLSSKFHSSQIEHLLSQPSKQIEQPCIVPQKIKKTTYLEKRSSNQNPQFSVCMHCFVGSPDIDPKCENCVCRERGFCLPSCLCTNQCPIMRVGCLCNRQDSCLTQKCVCFLNKLECQPGICGDCFASRGQQKRNNCRNDQVLRDFNRKIVIGASNIIGAGLGAFAGEDFSKNDLICIYSGEHINSDIDYIRQSMIKDLSFYNFDSPNGKSNNASIDARFMGNKARFINHGNEGEQNLRAQTISSNGTEYIVLFALREIKQGQQLSFNYDGSGVLYAHHRNKYPFIKPPSKKN